jgi:hypothetical protein
MVEPFIESTALKASERGLSNGIDDLYTYLKSQAAIKIKNADIQHKLPLLREYINSVRLVKTLWQIDRPIDVESFYCDSHIILKKPGGKEQYRKTINFVSDLDSKDNFVIQGIAGQGKSILLRHLFINEVALGKRIPIFIELRRVQKDETLLTHIFRFLQILDLPADSKLFQILLKSGRFIFFLDGFDEISKDQMPPILNELEYLTSISRSCQFIVTSRPDSPIAMSPLFNVVLLDNLRHDEYQQVIRKLSNAKEYADAIIARIKAQQPGMSELLCTPLLVTLLLVSYKSYQTIPVQLSDFYESIFMNLLQRHDGTKPTFTRARRCSLNDNQYRQVFDSFCFESKKQNTILFDYQQVYSSVEKAMSLLGIKEDIDSYIKDIKNITCLLLEESGQYRFIHGTVQNYYSASFLKNLPEPSAARFYQSCLDESKAFRWHQELKFLADIDTYRHAKYYLITLCSRYMGYDHEVDPNFLLPAEISLERTKNIVGSWEIGFLYNGPPHLTYISFGRTLVLFEPNEHQYVAPIFALDYPKALLHILKDKTAANVELQPFSISLTANQQPDITPSLPSALHEKEVSITVRQILDSGFFTSEFQSVAQTMAARAYARWQEAVSYLKKRDAFIETVEVI